MTVSPDIAAALSAKYPHLAAQAAGAVPLDAQIQTKVSGGLTIDLGRYRKYRMPGGAIVVLDEPLPSAEESLRAKNAALKARAEAFAAQALPPPPSVHPAPKAAKKHAEE